MSRTRAATRLNFRYRPVSSLPAGTRRVSLDDLAGPGPAGEVYYDEPRRLESGYAGGEDLLDTPPAPVLWVGRPDR